MKNFKKYLGTGLLVTLPITITLYILYKIITFFDNMVKGPIDKLLGFHLPGLGIIIVFLLVFIIGIFSSHFFGKKLVKLVEKIFSNMPIIKKLYSPIRDIVKTFIGNSKGEKSFSKVVLVDFPTKDSKSIGFITKENVKIGNQEYTSIFIPTTPNPTNGFLIYKKYSQLKVLDMPVEQGINMVVSMSTTSIDKINFKEEEE